MIILPMPNSKDYGDVQDEMIRHVFNELIEEANLVKQDIITQDDPEYSTLCIKHTIIQRYLKIKPGSVTEGGTQHHFNNVEELRDEMVQYLRDFPGIFTGVENIANYMSITLEDGAMIAAKGLARAIERAKEELINE